MQAAAYRSASRLYDERTGQWFDYTRKEHVIHSEILLPVGADQSFADRSTLWNHIEKIEKRRDSQLAKDYILALPKELSLEENKELARRFAEYHFVSKGLVADINIHYDAGNPHAHIFVTTRRLLGMSFSQKARDLNPEFFAGQVVEKDYWNTKWREFQNIFFEELGVDLFVDPNHLVPTVHRGRKKNDDRADYIDAKNEYNQELSREIALSDPDAVLNQLSRQYMAFSDREIACILNKATKTTEEFQTAMIKLKAHPSLVSLGPGDDGRERYATRQAIETESRLQDNAFKLQKNAHHIVSTWRVKEQITRYGLNEGQANALNHVMLGGGIAIVVGKAGTGKSYLMKAANDIWQQEGYRVLGISVAGIASESLEFESNIQSSTIASFKYRIEKKKLQLNDKDVIVLDEAAMVDAYELNTIVKLVREAGAKLILIGDHKQVQPIGPGAPFRALLEKIGFVELTEIKRQKLVEDRLATTLLSTGKTGEAIDIYAQKGQVNLSNTVGEAQAALIGKWGQDLVENIGARLTESIILAHRNEDVKALNLQARDYLVKSGFLTGKGTEVETINGKITLTVGDRILFTENSWKLKVKNGHFATIKSIKGLTITATIIKGKKEREVVFDANEYKNFSYGYAATIYKTQGVTVSHTFVYAGGEYWSRNLIYVALSRHRDLVHLFADRETHKDFETLKKNLSRFSIKDAVIDFPLHYALRRGFDPDKLLGKCMGALHQAKEAVKDKWLFLANYEAYQDRVLQAQKEQTTQQRRQDAVLVARFTNIYREVGRQWSDMKRELKPGEELANHARFSQNYDLIVERNRLAHELYSNAAKYELAMELNDVSLSELKRHSEAHEAREHVLLYETLAKKGSNLEAGRVAEDIRNNGKAHGQFVRERGLSWDAINKLGKSYTERTLLHSLDPVERKRHREVISYLGQGRDSVAIFKRKNPDPTLALFPTSERNAETKALQVHLALSERDKLAHHLFTHQDQYAKAIEHFKIPLDKLAKEAKRHEYRKTILAFIQAEQPDKKHGKEDKKLHELLSQNIAYTLKQTLVSGEAKKICGSVIKELELLKGMTWEKIHLSAWAYSERLKGFISPEQKAAMKAYASYRLLNRDLAEAVGRNQPNEKQKEHPAKPEQEKAQRNLKYARIKALVDKRDKAADRLWGELVNLDERSLKKLDIARLQKESENHHKRNEVKALKFGIENGQFESLQTQLTSEILVQNPAYEKLLKEQRLTYKIKGAVKVLEERRALKGMSVEDRKLYLEVKEYQTLSIQSAKAWKRGFAEAKNGHALVQQVKNTQVAQAFTDQRNALAFKLTQNLPAYEPHLKALRIDTDKLARAASKHAIKQKHLSTIEQSRTFLMSQNTELKHESYNADRISEALIDMGEGFYQKVLGDLYIKPKRQGHNIRLGSKGSFSITVSGSHQGAWHSFESGEGGYPIQLLMNANYGYGLNFEDALKEGARIAGLSDSQAKDITYKRKQKSLAEIEMEARLLAQEKEKKIETARYYCKTSLPIEGTVAERYLRETRKIESDLSGFRYHPRVKDPQTERYYPAALIAAKNEQGRITAVQTILIDPYTLKKANVEVAKRTRGVISGSAALIHQGASNKLFIAEGPETAASLIKAVPDANIYVTVGNIRNSEHLGYLAKKHNTNTFYFAADNDGGNLKPAQSLQKAAAKLEAQGIKCYKAMPQLIGVEKPDFNDVIIHKGTEGVKAQLNTMHRIINESEKIDLGLIKQREHYEVNQSEDQQVQLLPTFTIIDEKFVLSEPLRAQFKEYLDLSDKVRGYAREQRALIMSSNQEERKHYGKLLDETSQKRLELSQTLTEQNQELWAKIKELAPVRDVSSFDRNAFKGQLDQNRLDAKSLHKFSQGVQSLLEEHKQSLQENRSRGVRF